MLGLNIGQYVDPAKIFETIQNLSSKFFGTGDGIDLSSPNPIIDSSFDKL